MKPSGGVLENVMGLKLAASGQLSPLDVIEKELSQLGFASTVVEIDSAIFLSVTRRRSLRVLLHVSR